MGITCPNEIAENTPGVIIVDNDDFRNDTLIGGDTSHRTNVMYVQPLTLEDYGSGDGERINKGKVLSSKLKEITEGMTSHERYITRKRGEPVVCDRVQLKLRSTEIQRKRFLIHALVRANNAGKRPLPVDQMIPSFFWIPSFYLTVCWKKQALLLYDLSRSSQKVSSQRCSGQDKECD